MNRLRVFLILISIAAVAVLGLAEKDLSAPPTGKAIDGAGQGPVATRGTLSVIYDDGSAETNTSGTGLGSQAGNKFVSSGAPWGTFYVDQVSVYWSTVDAAAWLTCYNSINTAGTDLGGNNSNNFSVSSGAGWKFIDGSTAAQDWVGNSTETFVNTVWIAADDIDFIGIDTSTTAGHGFTITSYSGADYTEDSGINAMIRPRLNGDSVPVELTSFNIE